MGSIFTEMRSLHSFNCSVKYLLRVINVFNKCTGIKSLMDEKSKTVLHDFIEIVSKSKHKQMILWIDHGREFYNKLMQKWLDNDDIFM